MCNALMSAYQHGYKLKTTIQYTRDLADGGLKKNYLQFS